MVDGVGPGGCGWGLRVGLGWLTGGGTGGPSNVCPRRSRRARTHGDPREEDDEEELEPSEDGTESAPGAAHCRPSACCFCVMGLIGGRGDGQRRSST